MDAPARSVAFSAWVLRLSEFGAKQDGRLATTTDLGFVSSFKPRGTENSARGFTIDTSEGNLGLHMVTMEASGVLTGIWDSNVEFSGNDSGNCPVRTETFKAQLFDVVAG